MRLIKLLLGLLLAGALIFVGVFAFNKEVRNNLLKSWGVNIEETQEPEDETPGEDEAPGEDETPEECIMQIYVSDEGPAFKYLAGMTWGEFISSEYNVDLDDMGCTLYVLSAGGQVCFEWRGTRYAVCESADIETAVASIDVIDGECCGVSFPLLDL